MKTKFKISVIATTIALACCSTTPMADKPDVQAPLKLSEASETMTQVCSSYGCDDVLRSRCEGTDFKVLSQNTVNQYSSRKNNVTGGFDNSRAERVNIIFKCVTGNDKSPVTPE